MTTITGNDLDQAALSWLGSMGWQVLYGPNIGPDGPFPELRSYGQVVLERRLLDALAELNPDLPSATLDNVPRELTHPEGSNLEARNREFHRMLIYGVTVEYWTSDGNVSGVPAQVVDFDNPSNNNWLAVNQFSVAENPNTRRPDVMLFVNGLPLGIIELKNPVDEDATLWTAWNQLQTYKSELPALFSMNESMVVSAGMDARIGALTAGKEWFKPRRTIGGEAPQDGGLMELQVMLIGVCVLRRFLSLVHDFIVFEDDGRGKLAKKMTGYHQFHAVRVAEEETRRAASTQRIPESRGRYEAGLR